MPTYPIYPVNTGKELTLTRFYEDERIKLSGQRIRYWWLDRSANVDPLYQEPTVDPLYGDITTESSCGEWAYTEMQLIAAIEFQESQNKTDNITDEGLSFESDATMFISYLEWQRLITDYGIPANTEPKEGDVVFCMGKYFDVKKAGENGNLVDTVDAVGFSFELINRSKFDPQRKING